MSEVLLSEKYRPKTIDEAILTKSILEVGKYMIEKGEIPNVLFYGDSGLGKTTLAYILCDELGYESIYINASDEGRSLDVVRTTIRDFAIGTSLTGSKKVVILDEFCGCTNVVQDALKSFFEQYSSTCSFILTANNINKINKPILSRFSQIHFTIPKDEEVDIKIRYVKRLNDICKLEGIVAEKSALMAIVNTTFPDYRATLNLVQNLKMQGDITIDSVSSIKSDIKVLVAFLKEKNFNEMMQYIGKMPSIDVIGINRELRENCEELVVPASRPALMKILQMYNYQSAFSRDNATLMASEMTDIMIEVEFK
jgi:DNA polymerase III delta prime subunit